MMGGPHPITSVYKEKSIHRHTELCVNTGRDCSDATNQGMSRVNSNHQKPEEAKKHSSLECLEEAWPCQHLGFGL